MAQPHKDLPTRLSFFRGATPRPAFMKCTSAQAGSTLLAPAGIRVVPTQRPIFLSRVAVALDIITVAAVAAAVFSRLHFRLYQAIVTVLQLVPVV
jgi:hypothetical protein